MIFGDLYRIYLIRVKLLIRLMESEIGFGENKNSGNKLFTGVLW